MISDPINKWHKRHARSQPSDNGGSFSSDFGPFQNLKTGIPSGCLGGNLDF